MHRIFISSVQKELATERRALKDYIHGDPLLRRFFEVFLFEDLPASDRRADAVYLDEVGRCDIYVGLFGDEYGFEDAEGISPTHREFTHATQRRSTFPCRTLASSDPVLLGIGAFRWTLPDSNPCCREAGVILRANGHRLRFGCRGERRRCGCRATCWTRSWKL